VVRRGDVRRANLLPARRTGKSSRIVAAPHHLDRGDARL